MSSNPSQTQNTYTIPGQEAGSSSDQADFDRRFQQITQSDEQLRALQNDHDNQQFNQIASSNPDLQSLEKITDAATSADQQFVDIVGGDPLLQQLEKDTPIDLATAAVHERIATRADEEQRANERTLVLNIADRISMLRAEHDVVNQAV